MFQLVIVGVISWPCTESMSGIRMGYLEQPSRFSRATQGVVKEGGGSGWVEGCDKRLRVKAGSDILATCTPYSPADGFIPSPSHARRLGGERQSWTVH